MFSFNNVKGIIFDLDDTLVKTQLDFVALKREIGCALQDDILRFIDSLQCSVRKAAANQIVLNHELEDAATSLWMPGAQVFVQQALKQALPLAIVTRNCRQASDIKISNNNIPIDLVMTREDGPAKPNPSLLNAIASQWNIPNQHIAYIGDYIYDIQAAHNANMQAWLFKFENSKDTGNISFAEKLHYIRPKIS